MAGGRRAGMAGGFAVNPQPLNPEPVNGYPHDYDSPYEVRTERFKTPELLKIPYQVSKI